MDELLTNLVDDFVGLRQENDALREENKRLRQENAANAALRPHMDALTEDNGIFSVTGPRGYPVYCTGFDELFHDEFHTELVHCDDVNLETIKDLFEAEFHIGRRCCALREAHRITCTEVHAIESEYPRVDLKMIFCDGDWPSILRVAFHVPRNQARRWTGLDIEDTEENYPERLKALEDCQVGSNGTNYAIDNFITFECVTYNKDE